MQREKLATIGSTILLGIAIIGLPNQFLFSKNVPNSFWTEHFQVPFGAGWFIAFIVLAPAIWSNKSLLRSIKNSTLCTLLSMLIAVPLSLFMMSGTLSLSNLFSQYLWVSMLCIPPLILQIVLRCLFFYTNRLLKGQNE